MARSLSQFAVCARLSLLLWAAARLCLPVGQVGKAVPAGGEMELQTALLRSTVARVPLLSMVFAEPAEKSALLRHSVDTENELLMHTPTPYGSVLQEIEVPKEDGTSCVVLLARPRALLWLAVHLSSAFRGILTPLSPGGIVRCDGLHGRRAAWQRSPTRPRPLLLCVVLVAHCVATLVALESSRLVRLGLHPG